MKILVDTNVILRLTDSNHAQHPTAVAALDKLSDEGHEFRLVPQNVYEFWVVGTRPVENNGLGFTPADLRLRVNDLTAMFPLFRDERLIFDHWRQLVVDHTVSGKPAHDARLAAAMKRHGLTHVLTFNSRDFKRYPHVTAMIPEEVLA